MGTVLDWLARIHIAVAEIGIWPYQSAVNDAPRPAVHAICKGDGGAFIRIVGAAAIRDGEAQAELTPEEVVELSLFLQRISDVRKPQEPFPAPGLYREPKA